MTTVSDQVQYESRLRNRFAVIAFCAAILLVVAQLFQLSLKPAVSETTVEVIYYNAHATTEIVATVIDMLGLLALAVVVFWLHRSAQARQPQLRTVTRIIASGGAVVAAVMAVFSTIAVTAKAHDFVSTGSQSYPEAQHLFSGGVLLIPQLFGELGNLLVAVGVILVALGVMRVGLVPRIVGYTGVIAGALFIIPVPLITPVVQGFWLAATAVLLARRWPSGDPPAWESGEAVPWPPTARQQAQADRARQRGNRAAARGARGGGGRQRVSDKEVLAAVEPKEAPPNPRAGRSKRKRRK